MAFRKVSSGKFKYVKYAECKPGQVLAEGHYLGAREGKFGIQHQIQEQDVVTVLNSSGHLNWLIENNVDRGDLVRVVYVGMEKLEKGRFKNKEAHRFDLEIDDSRKVKVKGTVNEETDGEDQESSEEVDDSSPRGRSGGLASRYSRGGSGGNVGSSLRNAGGNGGSARAAAQEDESEESSQEEAEQTEKARQEDKEAMMMKYRTRRA